MLKYIFAFIVLIHGLVHFMGFAKAFGYGHITQLTKDISKPAGFLWLITAFLFIVITVLFFLKKESWSIMAVIAVLLSQILIIISWRDAKFGTLANIVILLAAVPAYAVFGFDKMVKKEAALLLSSQHVKSKTIITKEMINSLPPIVQHWLMHSGVMGKEKVYTVRLQQKGEMRTKPGGKWMPFTATQYFTVDTPAFNWQTTVEMMPLITLHGRDKFEDGKGEMMIKLLSLIKVADARNDNRVNESTMLRYLGETCWFPSAALADYMQWQAIDSLSAKATMQYKGIPVSGIFQFDVNGDMLSFTGDRWYGSGKDATLEKWFIKITDHKTFDGISVPNKCEVTWKLKSGDFNWLKLEITDLEYNSPQMY